MLIELFDTYSWSPSVSPSTFNQGAANPSVASLCYTTAPRAHSCRVLAWNKTNNGHQLTWMIKPFLHEDFPIGASCGDRRQMMQAMMR
jgi:hypothetical protein